MITACCCLLIGCHQFILVDSNLLNITKTLQLRPLVRLFMGKEALADSNRFTWSFDCLCARNGLILKASTWVGQITIKLFCRNWWLRTYTNYIFILMHIILSNSFVLRFNKFAPYGWVEVHQNQTVIYAVTSVTRSGYFWTVSVSNFLSKVAQYLVTFWAILKCILFKWKQQ